MKNNNSFFNWNVKKIPMGIIALFWTLALPFSSIVAQTTVFSEDFNRGSVVSPITNGGLPIATTYTTTTTSTGTGAGSTSRTNLQTGSDYSLQILSASQAAPDNQQAGKTYVYAPLSSYSSPFNSVLNLNSGPVTWYFNMKTNRSTANSGFTANGYSSAAVLAATSSNFATGANGYCVYMVKGTTYNAVFLGSFTGGLSTTPTNILGTSKLELAGNTDWVAIKVVYTPSTNTWQLFARDDAATKGDPTTVSTQIGTGTNTTYTPSTMTHFGFFYGHSAGASYTSYTMFFDDYKVTVPATAAPSTQASNLTFNPVQSTSLTANWTPGNGGKKIVIINTVNSFTDPTNGVDPTANSVYSGSGEQVVFNGNANSAVVTGLTPNSTYYFRVYEYCYGASFYPYFQTSSSTNNTNSVKTTLLELPTPTVSTATAFSATGFTANWTPVANAVSYDVKLYQGTTLINTTNVNDQSSSSSVLSGLTAGLSYTYTVTAKSDGINYNNSFESVASAIYTSSTPALYSAFNVSDIRPNGFTVYWVPTSNATGYNVNVYQAGDLVSTTNFVGQAVFSGTVTGLSPNLPYTFTVSGSDGFPSVSSQMITTLAPIVLENFQNWTDQSTAGSFTKTKTLYDGVTTGTFTSTSLIVASGQSIGSAGTVFGSSNPSVGRVQIAGTTSDLTLPQISSIGQVFIKTNAGTDLSSFKLQQNTGTVATPVWTDIANTSIPGQKNVTPLQTYNLSYNTAKQIRLLANQSGSVNIWDLQVNPYIGSTKLSSPTVGSASAVIATGFTANWTPVDGNALGYYVKVYQGANLVKIVYADLQSTSSLVVTGLLPSTLYSYSVIAKGDLTNYLSSDASSVSGSFTTANQLATPIVTAGGSNRTSSGFTANWTAVTNASSYNVMVYDATPAQVGATANVAAVNTSLAITGLNADASYTYTVTAIGDQSTYYSSPVSAASAAYITSLSTPVVGTTSGVSLSGFTSNWTPVTNASSYDINIYQDASLVDSKNASPGTASSFAETGLNPNVNYTYTVTAKGDGALHFDSAPSSPIAVLTTDLGTGINPASITGVSFDGQTIHNNANVDLQVFDATGRLMISSNKNINMTSYSKGMYVAKSSTGTLKISLKN